MGTLARTLARTHADSLARLARTLTRSLVHVFHINKINFFIDILCTFTTLTNYILNCNINNYYNCNIKIFSLNLYKICE